MCTTRVQTIHELVAAQADRTPDAPAIAAPGRSPLCYAELLVLLKRLGSSLHGVGIGRSDTVVVAMPHGAEATVASLSVAAYSAVVPVDPHHAEEDTARVFRALDPSAVLVPAREKSRALQVAYDRGTPVIEVEGRPEVGAGTIHPVTAVAEFDAYPIPAQPENLAICLPATPEAPEDQRWTHGHVYGTASRMVAGLHLGPDDRCLNLIPLWDAAGSINEVVATLLSGGCVVCPPSATHELDFFDWLDECRPTWFTADERMQREILTLAGSSDAGAIGESGIRFVQSNETDISPEVRAGLERVLKTKVLDRRIEA